MKELSAALTFGFTLLFEFGLVLAHKPLSGWLGAGGFLLAVIILNSIDEF